MDTRARREQIVRAALALAASRGVGGVTVERVAEAVDLAPSALYRHFSGKEAILDAMIEEIHALQMETLARAEDLAPDDPLRALGLILERLLEKVMPLTPAVPRLFFSDQVWVNDPERKNRLSGFLARYRAGLADLVARGQAMGRIRDDYAPQEVTMLFLGVLLPPVLVYHLDEGSFDLEHRIRRGFQLFKHAVRPCLATPTPNQESCP
jgi:AcrR family transcriptional regulator